jgi:protein-S-isoprenylcysteine O-methyltransferase Ste14
VNGFGHLYYVLAWIGFGASHSLLASERIKAGLGWLGRWYRLVYNGVALLTIVVVIRVGEHGLFPDVAPYAWPNLLQIVRWIVFGLGMALMVLGLRGYDLSRFAGLRQIRHPEAPADEPLRLDGMHRFVRHPIYLSSLLLLWGRVGNEAQLATAIWGSAYLIVGMKFEERRLVRLYGNAYRDYRSRVPALFPWKGRVI